MPRPLEGLELLLQAFSFSIKPIIDQPGIEFNTKKIKISWVIKVQQLNLL